MSLNSRISEMIDNIGAMTTGEKAIFSAGYKAAILDVFEILKTDDEVEILEIIKLAKS